MAAVIGYLRVSTKGQGESGLGLEAQRAAIDAHCKQTESTLAMCYLEVESGKLADRPELLKALAHARRSKAQLVVAKVDRLARNARFLLTVVESGADVIFCDFPTIPPGPTGKFILTQMAAVAELEAGLISQRTKAALAAYKARGGKLGAALPQCRNLTQEARKRGAQRAGEAVTKAAKEAYADLRPIMQQWHAEENTLETIAEKLNAQGHITRRGRPWNQVQVARVLQRS
jgi:DNA invertase Pin-like site-specific DNA recombinase